MTADPLGLIPNLRRATQRLLRTVESLDGPAVAASSLLPGWSKGHVLTHVARNADSCTRRLAGILTGERVPQYPSDEVRTTEIENGAGRTPAAHHEDIRASAERLFAAFEALPATEWATPVATHGGPLVPAASLVWVRLREVEVHHVDLDTGYSPADWEDAFTLHLLHELEVGFAAAPPVLLDAVDLGRTSRVGGAATDECPTVRGPGSALAAWLIGRSDGATLAVVPDGPLPPVPTWR